MKKNINEFRKGDQIRITHIDCGRNIKKRLTELGLFLGSSLEIIKNDKFNPVVLGIFDSKIALGRGEASKIYGEKI